MDRLQELRGDKMLQTFIACGVVCKTLFDGAVDFTVTCGKGREEMFVYECEVFGNLFIAG